MMRKKPMLAYPVSDKPIDYSKKVYIQPKLDGVRCLIQYDKKTGVTAWSRTGKQWKNIHHITSSLESWFQSNQTTVLDGELYNHDFKDDFEQIISMVRKTKPTPEARLKSAENVQFHCYDIIDEELPFDQRCEFISESLMLMGNSVETVTTCFGSFEVCERSCFTNPVFHSLEVSL